MPAPIGYTCGDIDSAIRHVETEEAFALSALTSIRKQLEGADIFEDIVRDINHLETYIEDITAKAKQGFEDIRESNTTLRQWGEGLEEELEDLKEEHQSEINQAISTAYDEGLSDGEDDGYDRGFKEGYEQGRSECD